MSELDFIAILAGITTAIFTSAFAGALLGIGFAVDMMANDPEVYPKDDNAMDEAFGELRHKPGFAFQMAFVNIAISALSGAVTAWLAPHAPLLNALVVGLVGMGVVALGRDMPRPLVISGLATTLPATVVGAWLMT
ncbi:MAG TPA: hypothetical protein ENK28_05850 [Aliiroseovarius sp.]|nr:hypothetical protein [Aliiroseovarius sp.]